MEYGCWVRYLPLSSAHMAERTFSTLATHDASLYLESADKIGTNLTIPASRKKKLVTLSNFRLPFYPPFTPRSTANTSRP